MNQLVLIQSVVTMFQPRSLNSDMVSDNRPVQVMKWHCDNHPFDTFIEANRRRNLVGGKVAYLPVEHS